MQNTIGHSIEDLRAVSGHIVITTHHKPDGDAMGSSLAIYNYLKAAGIKSTVITPTDYAHVLHWMPGNEDVLIYYASSDTRMHVAVSTLEKLTDYVMNTPEDAGRTQLCAIRRDEMITRNLDIINKDYPYLKKLL